jgi:hypothetical protein
MLVTRYEAQDMLPETSGACLEGEEQERTVATGQKVVRVATVSVTTVVAL